MKMRIFVAILLLACTVPAMANCKDPITQTEMNQCAAADLKRADAQLNASYKKLMTQLDANQKAEVKSIQLAWIKFKDLNCKFESSSAEGGSMQPLLRDTCLTQLTEARTKDLKSWIESFGL